MVGEETLREEYTLTSREVDVIRLACQGLTSEKITDRLFLSQLTVRTHLKRIFEKVGVRNRLELSSRLQFG